MFKAKLIEDKNYYKLRSKQLWLMLLPSILIGLLVNFYQIPIWLIIAIIGLYILTIILMNRNQKSLNSMVGNNQIEIDDKEIRIISKRGIHQEIITLDNVDKLILKNSYSIPQETIKELGQEMTGKTKQNYLILQQNNQKRKIDFEIDSYFMLKQLDKLIDSWESKGYIIERVNHS